MASLKIINSNGESGPPIISNHDQLVKLIDGRTGKFSHGYEHIFHINAFDPRTFVYDAGVMCKGTGD